MAKITNVLSLFDGLSCGQIALNELGIKVDKYYASEIDKYAIMQTQHNFPGTIQLGSVLDVDVSKLEPIDILIGGSPCQSFSFAGKRNGMTTTENEDIYTLDRYLELKSEGFQFEGQSYLFWEYMRILTDIRKYNPNVKFLLENVEMGNKWERVLSEAIGIRPVHINSALVSAQNRRRLYWVGQIRERLYYSENYCYLCGNEKYKKNENRRVQEESQRKGTAKVLGNSQKRYVNLQSMPKRVFKSKSERDNKNLFGGMSIDQQKNQRQKQESDNQKSIHEEVLSGKQTGASEISIGIQENKCRERNYAKGRFKTISSKEGEIQSIQGNESSKKQEDFRDNKYFESKTDMCCVQCGKGLDHRPRYSFVEGWKKYEGKSPSSLSKVQFDEIKQNDGRVYDIIPVGVQGLDSIFGETINPIPQPKDEGILLRDILEEEVDDKYYLSEKLINFFHENTKKMKENGNGFAFKPTYGNKKGNAVTTKCGSRMDDDFICVAQRGRENGQNFEPNYNGKTNCITSVQKDNLVMQLNQRQKTNLKDGNGKADAFLSTSWKGSQANGMTLINSINKHNEKRENKRRSCEILLALREEINSKKNVEREMAVYARFFKDEVLFKRMYDKFISESEVRAENDKEWEKPSSKNVTNCNVLNMQFENWYRCSSQRQKPIKQFIRQLAACMSELSQQNTSSKESMYYLWQTTKRVWVLRKALSEIQKIWEPTCSETKPVQQSGRIRRLTPTEASRLQTVPSWYKWIVSETQQYKMLGNGWNIKTIMHILKYLNN